jgi:hypothetical protein
VAPQPVPNGSVQGYGVPLDPYAQPGQYAPPIQSVVLPPGPPAPLPPYPIVTTHWGGAYAGFEAAILAARVGSSSVLLSDNLPVNVEPTFPIDELPVNSLDFHPDFDLEFSPRVWVGYKGPGGWGVRARWWHYDHAGAGIFELGGLPLDEDFEFEGEDLNVTLASTLATELKIDSIDLEGTQDGEFHNWDFQVAGGVRYARIDFDQIATIDGVVTVLDPEDDSEFSDTFSAFSEFKGVGPTIAVAARRPFYFNQGLAFLVNLRLAFLFGETDATLISENAFEDPIVAQFQEHLIQVWEIQVGFEYSRQLQNSVRVFASALLEAQVWEWNSPLGIAANDLGFFGPTIGVGLAR